MIQNFVGEDFKVFEKRQGTFNRKIKNIKSQGITQTNRVRGSIQVYSDT